MTLNTFNVQLFNDAMFIVVNLGSSVPPLPPLDFPELACMCMTVIVMDGCNCFDSVCFAAFMSLDMDMFVRRD